MSLLKGCRVASQVAITAQRSMSSTGAFSKRAPLAPTTKIDDARQKTIHMSSANEYPQVAPLPLPPNIDPNESICFSPLRSRDISGTEIQCHQAVSLQAGSYNIDVTSSSDPHIESYDYRGSCNLNCMMQSNVPQPFGGAHKFTNLNMPGGQWAQNDKFMAQDLQASHYTNLRQQVRSDWDKKGVLPSRAIPITLPKRSYHCLAPATNHHLLVVLSDGRPAFKRLIEVAFSTKETDKPGEKLQPEGKESSKSKLKQAVKQYGSTVMVFHVGISLVSLGMFYALFSSGLDVVAAMEYLNLSDSVLASKVGTGASTFVIAYTVHKIFAPVRISITLGATPFIVRMLRKRGILKAPTKGE